jgi:hypothetical protein
MGPGGWGGWQGGVTLPNHTLNPIGCFRTSFPRHYYSPPIQESLQLPNISKRKAEAGSSSLSPSFYNLASKRWEGASCPDSCSNVSVWPFKYWLKYNFPVSSSNYPASKVLDNCPSEYSPLSTLPLGSIILFILLSEVELTGTGRLASPQGDQLGVVCG